MTPLYQIVADGTDITAACAQRLLELTITDEAGTASDTATIKLDNQDLAIEAPRKGAVLDISLGYEDKGLRHMGLYTVDEIEAEGPPHSLTMKAKAADMRAGLKQQKTRGWDEVLIGDLVTTIAAEHRLIPVVSKAYEDIRLAHLAQTNESDINLLTRIGKNHNAVAKVLSNRLLFVPMGESKSASGQFMPPVFLGSGDIGQYKATQADRGRYGCSHCPMAQSHNRSDRGSDHQMWGGAGLYTTLQIPRSRSGKVYRTGQT